MSVAVLLNRNARKVNSRVCRQLARIVPRESLFISHTPEEACATVREIAACGVETLFIGGGDGTFIAALNDLFAAVPSGAHDERVKPSLPTIGLLKLGTGNGICYDLGIGSGFSHLERALKGERLPTREIPLIEHAGRLTHFAGVGWDAAIVNDFVDWKKSLGSRRLQRVAAGLAGYFYSTLFLTIPKERHLTGKVEADIINLAPVEYADPLTNKMVRLAAGELLYRGPLSIGGVSVTPYFGYGMKAFPLAGRKRDLMSLRAVSAKIRTILGNLHKVWNGSFRHPDIRDWLVRDVEIRLSQPRPLQVGGDAAGYHEKIRFTLSPHSIRVIDLWGRP